MSSRHPVIAVTGSSGAGTTTVMKAFAHIFRREGLKAEVIEGDSFHRYSRIEMRERVAAADSGKGPAISHFGPEANLLAELADTLEEYGATGDSDRRWVIDPIDGTKNFVRGVPVWASLVALLDDGVPQVGVVSAPALHRRWWASAGAGAFVAVGDTAARRLSVSSVAQLNSASLSFSSLSGWNQLGLRDRFLDLTDAVWRVRAFGDFLEKQDRYARCGEFLDIVRRLWTADFPVTAAGGAMVMLATLMIRSPLQRQPIPLRPRRRDRRR